MQKVLYALGLISLPLIYIVLMLITDQPIEWGVLGLMALICTPLLFWRTIGKVEQDFNALPDQDKVKKVAQIAKTIALKDVGPAD